MERILDAAARIFHEQGYAGVTTNDIADEADVSIGSLYQYFPNKDAILFTLTERHLASTTAGLTGRLGDLRAETDFEMIIRSVVEFLVDQHEADDLHLLIMHEAPRTHQINVQLDHARTALAQMASGLLAGRIDDPRRRELIARMVVATIDASVHDVILRQATGAPRDAAVDLTIATALSIIESA